MGFIGIEIGELIGGSGSLVLIVKFVSSDALALIACSLARLYMHSLIL